MSMKSAVLLFAVGSLCFLAACGEDDRGDLLDAVKRRGVVRISVDRDYPPQSSQAADGTWSGFDVDVGRAIAEGLGVTPEFLHRDWEGEVLSPPWSGIDMSVGSMSRTTERLEKFEFALPGYYFTKALFAVANGSSIDTVAEIANKKVCVGGGTTYAAWFSDTLGIPARNILQDPPEGVTVTTVEEEIDCVASVTSQESDAILSSESLIRDHPTELDVIDDPVFVEELCAAFDKQNELDVKRLAQEVGVIIKGLHDDGTLSELSLEHFGIDLTEMVN